MRIYIAAALPLKSHAVALADAMREAGHQITSTWHQRQDATVEDERKLSFIEMNMIGKACLWEIECSHALVVIVGPKSTRRGSWIEASAAAIDGKLVLAYVLEPEEDDHELWCPMSAAIVDSRHGDMQSLLSELAARTGS